MAIEDEIRQVLHAVEASIAALRGKIDELLAMPPPPPAEPDLSGIIARLEALTDRQDDQAKLLANLVGKLPTPLYSFEVDPPLPEVGQPGEFAFTFPRGGFGIYKKSADDKWVQHLRLSSTTAGQTLVAPD